MMKLKRNCLTLLVVSILIVSFCYFDVNIVPMAGASPSYEDFTTYTEVDPNSHIEKTANHIDFNAYENEDAYVYKDKGADHFMDFEHLVDVKDTHINDAVAGGVWAVSNDIDDMVGLETTGKTALMVFMYDHSTAGTRRIYIRETYDSIAYSDYYAPFTFGASYYLRIIKLGTAFSCEIYGSDADRTNEENVIDTPSLTLHGDWTFRYVFGAITYNVGEAFHTDVDVDNLDLQEAPPPASNSVELKSPNNGATETAWSVDFVFNATFYQTIQNASLHMENTTTVPSSISWTTHHWNTSLVENKTDETITFSFSGNGEGSYKWNIEVFNSTYGVYATSNRTLTIDVPPRYQNVDSNATSIEEGEAILLYAQGLDGIGLDYAWLWTNETGGIGQNYTEGYEFQEEWDSGNIASSTGIDHARNIIIDGDYLYGVTNSGQDFVVYNISSIDAPVQESLIALTYGARDLRKKGNYLLVSGTNGITTINVSDPENPSEVDQFTMGEVHGLFLVGDYLYCCQHIIDKFVILNVTDPTDPVEMGSLSGVTYFNGVHDVHVDGNYAYVDNYMAGVGEYGITVVNVTDKESPLTIIGVDANEKHSHVTKSGNYLYTGSHDPSDELTIYDVSSPSSPSLVGRFFSGEGTNFGYWMDWWDGFLVSTSRKTGERGIRLINVGDPSNPQMLASITTANSSGCSCIEVLEDRMFTSNVDITGSTYLWNIRSYSVTPLTYDSPMDMQDVADQWTWINFTWSNISISEGTTIQWKICMNDTYGNENCTTIQTFSIGEEEEYEYLFYDGFETGDLSLWDKGGDYPYADHDVQSSVKYKGTYASWMNGTASQHHRCEKNVTLTTESCVHLQFHVRIDEAPTGPASGFVFLAGLGDTTPTAEVMLCLNTTSMNFGLMTWHHVGNYTESDKTASLGTWYLIDIYVIVEESVYLLVDGTQEVCRNESESLSMISNVMLIYQIGIGGGWSGSHIIYHDDVLLDDACYEPEEDEEEAHQVGPFGPNHHRLQVNVRLNNASLKGCNVTVEGGPNNKVQWGLTDLFGTVKFQVKTGSYDIVATYDEYSKTQSVYVSTHMIVGIDLTEEDIIRPDVLPDALEDFLAWVKLPELDFTTETMLVFILPLIALVIYAVKKASEGPKRKWKYSYLK